MISDNTLKKLTARKKTPLVIRQRESKEKYQVRFWSKPELYKAFSKKCEEREVLIMDALNQFMEWYIND